MLFNMTTPLSVDVITVASAAADITPAALAAAISTLQVAAAASRECAMGVVAVAGAPVGTVAGATVVAHPHPSDSPPFVAASANTPAGPARGRRWLLGRYSCRWCPQRHRRWPPSS
jgi:hypothetical protein